MISTISRYVLAASATALLLCSLNGCMMVAGQLAKQGYDEVQAINAVSKMKKSYPYIDFNQLFPDTYRFELSRDQVYELIVEHLTEKGEAIIRQEGSKDIIFTAAQEVPLTAEDIKLGNQTPIYYQQSIYLAKKDDKITYVTNYPTVLKGDHVEMVIPLATNVLKGIFFGSLAAKMYPEKIYHSENLAVADKENAPVKFTASSAEPPGVSTKKKSRDKNKKKKNGISGGKSGEVAVID